MKKILVVDDEQANLKAVERMFFDADEFDITFEAAYVESGAAALEAVESFKPDVVLLDVMMPGMSGYEVCKRLKSSPATQEIMIMLLSGRTAVDDRLQGYAVGADDYITKPYDCHELLAKIRILLRLSTALADLRKHNDSLSALVAQRTKELVEKEKQAIIGQMVQGIVHNLRGPLTGIKGFNDLAQRLVREQLAHGENENESQDVELRKIDEYLGYSIGSQKRLEELISSLLVKGRNDADTKKVDLDINEVIKAELNFLQADMTFKHKITKEIELGHGLPIIRGRYSDFSQIFCNLVQNAVDAMHEAPERILTVNTKEEDGSIRVDFKDTGSGIKEVDRERIFEPFFTTKAREMDAGVQIAKKRPTGTGLGLYTCAEIIRSYGGSITVESSLESGSCFSLLIPVEPVVRNELEE